MTFHTPLPAPAHFRQTMGAFATGVAVVTTRSGDEHHGMTINSLASVSLDPCLLLICPRRGSSTGAAIAASRKFAVNVLASDQQDLARRFVGAVSERFIDLHTIPSRDGLPLLPGALAHLECAVEDIFPGGDHDIVVGKVLACTHHPGEPLVFYKGLFGQLDFNANG